MKKMQLKIILIVFGCVFFYDANAQKSDTLQTVNVTAQKDSILKLTVINSNVPHYILDKSKLDELSANDIGDALKFIPGTYIKDYGGIGGLKTVSYRSLGAAHTQVEVDGVILPNTQTATVNLSNFDVFSVEKIEITSGQVQNHFSTASSYIKANVLSINNSLFNIPKQNTVVKLLSTITSINSYQNGILFQQKLGKYWSIGTQALYTFGNGQYNFSIQNIDSTYSSTRQNSDLTNFKIKGALNYHKNRLKLHINSLYNYNNQQLPGAVVFYNPYNDQVLNNQKFNSVFNLQFKDTKYAIGANVFIQNNTTLYRDNQYLNQQGFLENTYFNQSYGSGLIYTKFLKTETQKLFVGLDFKSANLNGSQFTSTPNRNRINSVIGFSKWLYRLKIQGNLSHQFITDKTPNSTREISHFSPFLSIAYLPFKKANFRIRSHYKNNYRLPSFNDLYYNLIGNTNLKAENAQSFNLGLTFSEKYKTIQSEMTLDVYQNYIKDKIVAIPTKNLFNWSMQNIGDVRSQGIDFNLLFIYSKQHLKLTFSTGQSYNKSVDVTDKNGITYGHQIPYTPNYSASYTTTIGYKKTNFTLTLIQTGKRYVLNENLPFNELSGFVDLDIGINRTFNFKNQKIYANLQMANVLNYNYEVIKSFPMPGRHLRFKLVYTLKK